MQSGTAPAYAEPYIQSMQTDYMKAAVIAAWILAVGTLGFGFGVTSFAGWTALAVLSLVPPPSCCVSGVRRRRACRRLFATSFADPIQTMTRYGLVRLEKGERRKLRTVATFEKVELRLALAA